MKSRTIVLWALSMLCALTSCGSCTGRGKASPLDTLTLDEISRLFAEANDSFKLHDIRQLAADMGGQLNGTLLIARDTEILAEAHYGYRRLHGGKGSHAPACLLHTQADKTCGKMTQDALFDLASVSKQFTAAAILQLYDAGKLDLNDKIRKFFPGMPYGDVTIHQLLTHTSGIPEYFRWPYTVYGPEHYITNRELMRVLRLRRQRRDFMPGTDFKYCNTNYALLASIVEKAGGMTFEAYAHEHLFKPAGMTHTRFFSELDTLDDRELCCRGHWKSGKVAEYDRLDYVFGDKGIYSNTGDLLAWTRALFADHRILPEELLEKAAGLQNAVRGDVLPDEPYGYGFRLEANPRYGKLVYHGGLWNGFQNLYLYRPYDRLTIIFLSNFYNRAHAGKSNEVLHILDGA